MKLKSGIVQELRDFTQAGSMGVLFFNESRISWVAYGSHKGSSGGLLTFPSIGDVVICAESDNRDGWVYVTTITDPMRDLSLISDDNADENISMAYPLGTFLENWGSPNPYEYTLTPQVVALMSTHGAGIYAVDAATEDAIHRHVTVKSSVDNRLTISDVPNNEGIWMTTNVGTDEIEPQDIIKIAGTQTADPLGPRSIQLICKNNIWQETYSGNFRLGVYNGGLMEIINESPEELQVAGVDGKRTGEVYLTSLHNDIHLHVRKAGKRVIIQCEGDATNTIELRTTGNAQVHAGGNIDLDASQNINMKAVGDINIDGANIYLNSNRANPAEKAKSNIELEGEG